MGTHLITNLCLHGYRLFEDFEVAGLGRVNLITGKNNTGKTTLLEALQLLTSDGAAEVVAGILRLREELTANGTAGAGADARFTAAAGLFTGVARANGEGPSARLAADGPGLELEMRLVLISAVAGQDGSRQVLEGPLPTLLPDAELLYENEPALAFGKPDQPRYLPITGLADAMRPARKRPAGRPCEYVAPDGAVADRLPDMWERVELSTAKDSVVAALKVVEPSITNASVGASTRIAKVSSSLFSRPVPMRVLGDGVRQVFSVALALVNAAGGWLLIDEFENGLHHSVQADVWRAIFKLARDLDVQVFATTHSWDAVKSFAEAAAESPEEGVLVRLTAHEGRIVPTVFDENDLGIIAEDRLEVR